MKLRPAALAAPAVAALALTSCGWSEAPGVAIGPGAKASVASTTSGRSRLGSAAFGVHPTLRARLRPADVAIPRAALAFPQLVLARGTRLTIAPAVPTREAQLDGLSEASVVAPTAIRIPSHDVFSPVVPVGVDTSTGELSVPIDPGQVGWYQFGVAPGSEGSAVLAGHVDWKGQPGAFIHLDEVQPGEQVIIDLADGTTRTFVVTDTHLIVKTELPPALFERSGPPRLVLITCGGEFDRSIHRYRQNVVVVAVPA